MIQPPPLVPLRDGKTWYLYEPFHWHDVRVPSEFETDFASVPKLFTNLLPAWDVYGPAAILHDWLYWTQRCTRRHADDTLLAAMRLLGVPEWQTTAIYRAVRDFGFIAWNDNARLAKEGFSRMHVDGARVKCWKRKRLRAAVKGA